MPVPLRLFDLDAANGHGERPVDKVCIRQRRRLADVVVEVVCTQLSCTGGIGLARPECHFLTDETGCSVEFQIALRGQRIELPVGGQKI